MPLLNASGASMRRRDKARGKAAQPHKILTRRNAPKTARHLKASDADATEKIALLERRLSEALEQQTATSEVLKVIASSPGKLEPVFNSMLENATRICDANFGLMYLYESDYWRPVAQLHVPPKFSEWLLAERRSWGPETGLGRIAKSKQLVQIVDVKADRLYVQKDPSRVAFVELAGARTFLAVPVLKDDELIGALAIFRQEVQPFTDRQIELVRNFAAQAAFAIENTRLLDELRTRTNEFAQSVSELQALSEVSQAVNSTLDLGTVLTTIVSRAVELSRTDAGAIYVFDEEHEEFLLRATYGMSEAMIIAISGQHIGLGDGNNIATATTQRKPLQVLDARDEPVST